MQIELEKVSQERKAISNDNEFYMAFDNWATMVNIAYSDSKGVVGLRVAELQGYRTWLQRMRWDSGWSIEVTLEFDRRIRQLQAQRRNFFLHQLDQMPICEVVTGIIRALPRSQLEMAVEQANAKRDRERRENKHERAPPSIESRRRPCREYNSKHGCKYPGCRFPHECAICQSTRHGEHEHGGSSRRNSAVDEDGIKLDGSRPSDRKSRGNGRG
jgi:hypothetical protein